VLINTIPLLGAKDSSEIENIVTTTDQLFQYAQGHDNADPATKEALRYRRGRSPPARYAGQLGMLFTQLDRAGPFDPSCT
jgi:hypothetical protein